MGYEYEIVNSPSGYTDICKLPNGDVCSAWDFLEGKCGQRHSYCALHGYEIKTVDVDADPFSGEYAVCITSNGEEVGPVTELSGLREKLSRCNPD